MQEKAIAFPTDSRLLEVARAKIPQLAKRAGLKLRQSYEREGRALQRKAGGYAHAAAPAHDPGRAAARRAAQDGLP